MNETRRILSAALATADGLPRGQDGALLAEVVAARMVAERVTELMAAGRPDEALALYSARANRE